MTSITSEREAYDLLLTARISKEAETLPQYAEDELVSFMPDWYEPTTDDEIQYAYESDRPELSQAFVDWWNHQGYTPFEADIYEILTLVEDGYLDDFKSDAADDAPSAEHGLWEFMLENRILMHAGALEPWKVERLDAMNEGDNDPWYIEPTDAELEYALESPNASLHEAAVIWSNRCSTDPAEVSGMRP
ncbi:hypothetical protein [Leifsonia shinshuensis]|uniref:Uncharacterized protein n=1 Tax=Leifsonia shinshuensis TaxID=150026 RepID=A0A7G6YBK8_9MICO|nr:hypothetical protein [Leifsonia shinshuensis]QNE35873.1 hypothetical protein F1C12_12545 [Leifsonia shinshuensis]